MSRRYSGPWKLCVLGRPQKKTPAPALVEEVKAAPAVKEVKAPVEEVAPVVEPAPAPEPAPVVEAAPAPVADAKEREAAIEEAKPAAGDLESVGGSDDEAPPPAPARPARLTADNLRQLEEETDPSASLADRCVKISWAPPKAGPPTHAGVACLRGTQPLRLSGPPNFAKISTGSSEPRPLRAILFCVGPTPVSSFSRRFGGR